MYIWKRTIDTQLGFVAALRSKTVPTLKNFKSGWRGKNNQES